MHLIHNEQVKLGAAWCNNVGVGLALGGFVLPIYQSGAGGFFSSGHWLLALSAWIAAAGSHAAGFLALRRLRED